DDHMVDISVSSPALGFSAPVRMILPKDYNSQPEETWPVLFLLHGCCEVQDYKAWTHYTDVEKFMQDKNVLVVMPSDGEAGMYSDWWNFWMSSKPGYETFHMTELEQLIKRNYRASDTQAIAGLSIGGYGAMEYATRYPGRFAAAASYSGVLDTVYPVITQILQGILIRESENPFALWGDVFANNGLWSDHNPYDNTAKLRGTKLFVSSGNGTPGPLDPPGTGWGALESGAQAASQMFTDKLKQQGIPVTTDYYGNGTHAWPYWQQEFHKSWPLLASGLGVPTS
ncbi:MAG: alpha/beta hydrolase, partial [Sciscionella sp.]